MKKIILSEKEIELIKAQLEGKVEVWADDETQEILGGVIDKAEALMIEQEAFNEVGSDLIAWYWNKYQAQETVTTEE